MKYAVNVSSGPQCPALVREKTERALVGSYACHPSISRRIFGEDLSGGQYWNIGQHLKPTSYQMCDLNYFTCLCLSFHTYKRG